MPIFNDRDRSRAGTGSDRINSPFVATCLGEVVTAAARK
jgi:hypothetical protein